MVDASYIKGFFDGEGCVGLYSVAPHRLALRPDLRLSNTCLALLPGVKEWLEMAGYHPTLNIHRDHRPRCKITYSIVLRRWNDILRFIDEIGTRHPDKQNVFAQIKAYSPTVHGGRHRQPSIKPLCLKEDSKN